MSAIRSQIKALILKTIRIICGFSILFLTTGLPYNAKAEETEMQATQRPNPVFEQTVRLNDLIFHAYHENPLIQAAREQLRATIESFRVVTGYPDPQVTVTWFPEPIETRLGPQDWTMSLSQKIPFPGKLSKAGEVVAAEAEIARLRLDKTVRETVLAVTESFWELYYIRRAQETAEKNNELLEHLRKVAETTLARDRTMLTDIVKAQSQIGQLRYDRMLLEDLEHTETTRLNGLLNRSPDAGFGSLEQITFTPVVQTLNDMYDMAEKSQEDILIAGAREEKEKLGVDLARIDNLPDFNVGMFYSAIGDPDVSSPPDDAGRDSLGIRAGISIPLWGGKNKGRVERARAKEKSAKAMKTSKINNIRTQIRTSFFKLENARRIITLYSEELLPAAIATMETAETWFRQGQGTFSDYLEAQSVWYNFLLAKERARADYGRQLARLEWLTGQALNSDGKSSQPGTAAPKEAP